MGKKSRNTSTSHTRTSEIEQLNKTVDMAGGNPDPAVNALVSEDFLRKSNFDAADIALMLQQIVRGQDSLLAQAQNNSEEIARLRERQDKIDRDAIARHEAQKREIEEILSQSEKFKATGDAKDKFIANGVQMYQKEIQKARANMSVEKLKFEEALAREPKEIVVSGGQLAMVREGGQVVSKIFPEEVRIKHKVWVIQPGVATEVPKSVADALRNRRAGQAETTQLRSILSKNMEANELAEEWNKQAGGGGMPTVPG